MFSGVAKIPIANTFNELVGMDFADYGAYAAFLHIQGDFFAISCHHFTGAKKKEEQTAEMARWKVISNRLSKFREPGIIATGKDSMAIGEVPQDFRTSRNIVIAYRNSRTSSKFGGH